MNDRPPLLILGASARAAAVSASRAGFAPIAVDLFADADLVARFPAYRVEPADYPDGLFERASKLPDAPWIYTGALENHPERIDRLASERRLLGISGEGLRAVRDPAQWTAALRTAGLETAEVRVSGEHRPKSNEWLLKPLDSASGRRIEAAVGDAPIPPRWFVQERVEGDSVGATFVGDGRSANLLGVTKQLLGPNEAGLRVAYRGSLGPWPISPEARLVIESTGDVLASEFGLLGFFGIDFALSRRGPIVIEINPRYGASVEVLEDALGVSLLAAHARAFGIDLPSAPKAARRILCVAKRILFAMESMRVPDDFQAPTSLDDRPDVADVPHAGTVFSVGEPVLTVFGRGTTLRGAVSELVGRTRDWRNRFSGWARGFEMTRGEPRPASP